MKNSCWYASAQMLIQWRQEKTRQSISGLIPPEFDAQCAKIRDGDKGILNPQIVPMAKRLGLEAVPPMSPTLDTLEGWLKNYGPLWVNGKSHIVVIAGIDTSALTVKVYHPGPVNVGGVNWRSLQTWYAFGTSVSSRDTSAESRQFFCTFQFSGGLIRA